MHPDLETVNFEIIKIRDRVTCTEKTFKTDINKVKTWCFKAIKMHFMS